MWDSDGNSIQVLQNIIAGRCKEKSDVGEVSRLEPFSDGTEGAERIRSIIKGYIREGDEDVIELIKAMSGGSRK
jgi:hypothetical protein